MRKSRLTKLQETPHTPNHVGVNLNTILSQSSVPPTALQRSIENLNINRPPMNIIQDPESSDAVDLECAICLTAFEVGDEENKIIELPCGKNVVHIYHW